MDSQLLPHIRVRFAGVTWHRWGPGHIIDIPAADAPIQHVIDAALWITLKPGVVLGELSPDGKIGQRWEIPGNTVFLWPMNRPRRIMTPEGGEWLSIRLRATLFDRINIFDWFNPPCEIALDTQQKQTLKDNLWQLLRICHGNEPPAVDLGNIGELAQKLTDDYEKLSPINHWIAQSLGQAVFGLCWATCLTTEQLEKSPREIPQWLSTALEHFEKQSSLKVHEVAHNAGFSDAQFRRLFQQWTGEPPQRYLHQQRMERARNLLEQTELSVGEIAHIVGFSSVSHFTRVFKAAYSLTPTRHRQSISRTIA